MRLVLVLLLTVAAAAKDRIAYIEFYGCRGLDVDAIRKALPVHEGDRLARDSKSRIHEAVERLTGRAPEVEKFCCVGDGDQWIAIGLRAEHRQFYRAARAGGAQVSATLAKLYDAMDKAEEAAIEKGSAEEEMGAGYRLSKDPAARAAELAVRDYALGHEEELLGVLKSAANAGQRSIAADVLGYGRVTPQQTAALVEAARDPDDTVRNNASRALGEMAEADAAVAARIPPDAFIDMLRFGGATDLNKSTMVLVELTRSRDPRLLARLKSEAWEPLLEMASWRMTGWAADPRTIACRIQGVPEDRVIELAFGPVQAFLEAIR